MPPAIVMGDKIMGTCPNHLIPGPLGAPTPAPPMPFTAPVINGVVPTVLIQGKPAVVVGCTGFNLPPHVGLHPGDPFMGPPAQIGTVLGGVPTVLIGGKPAAAPTPPPKLCAIPGTIVGSAVQVMIGG